MNPILLILIILLLFGGGGYYGYGTGGPFLGGGIGLVGLIIILVLLFRGRGV